MNPAALTNTGTPTGAIIRYRRIIGGRLSTGIRLHRRKFSVRTVRSKLFNLFGSLKKRFFSKAVAPHASSSSSPSRVSTPSVSVHRRGGASKSPSNCRLKSLRRTNSFYAEAIADCLEFIKQSSAIDARPAPPLSPSTSF